MTYAVHLLTNVAQTWACSAASALPVSSGTATHACRKTSVRVTKLRWRIRSDHIFTKTVDTSNTWFLSPPSSAPPPSDVSLLPLFSACVGSTECGRRNIQTMTTVLVVVSRQVTPSIQHSMVSRTASKANANTHLYTYRKTSLAEVCVHPVTSFK